MSCLSVGNELDESSKNGTSSSVVRMRGPPTRCYPAIPPGMTKTPDGLDDFLPEPVADPGAADCGTLVDSGMYPFSDPNHNEQLRIGNFNSAHRSYRPMFPRRRCGSTIMLHDERSSLWNNSLDHANSIEWEKSSIQDLSHEDSTELRRRESIDSVLTHFDYPVPMAVRHDSSASDRIRRGSAFIPGIANPLGLTGYIPALRTPPNDKLFVNVILSNNSELPRLLIRDRELLTNLLEMKGKLCLREEGHNWKKCPRTHGEKIRRDPSEYTYSFNYCSRFDRTNKAWVCSNRDMCRYAHCKEEELYHPLKFRTLKCVHYPKPCPNVNCAFWHNAPSPIIDSAALRTLLLLVTDLLMPDPFLRGHKQLCLTNAERVEFVLIVTGKRPDINDTYCDETRRFIRCWLAGYWWRAADIGHQEVAMDDFFLTKAKMFLEPTCYSELIMAVCPDGTKLTVDSHEGILPVFPLRYDQSRAGSVEVMATERAARHFPYDAVASGDCSLEGV
eukprot:GHVH01004955.1.p1 GENE.GHVH01004955.1~~GHVH01004955.1.p1  ORF type:complete len:502 (+),score=57.12 GHVH01004955.1:468-1973(+)